MGLKRKANATPVQIVVQHARAAQAEGRLGRALALVLRAAMRAQEQAEQRGLDSKEAKDDDL